MNKDLINKRNTREWVKCNDDSKSNIWRESFISEHGGEFVKNSGFWEWRSIHIDEEQDYDNISNNRRIFRYCVVHRTGIHSRCIFRRTPVELGKTKVSLE